MDMMQFQNKLKEIQTLAMQNGKRVQAVLVEKFFEEDGMDREKIQKVYDYLEIQGIHVQGYSKEDAEGKAEEEISREPEKAEVLVPLTAEEEAYLREYLEAFEAEEESRIKDYQQEIVKAARELNREEIFFGDLLQEGNMGLLLALEHIEGKEDVHAWLCNEIRNTMRLFIEDQIQQKKEDHILVEKVRDLEVRVKELTEDENVKYSVEELAAFLDMDVEEMESVLRLTGDDK